MSATHFILLIEDDRGESDALATRLVRLGVEPIRVDHVNEAAEVVKSKEYAVRGVLLPSNLPGSEVHHAMKNMRRREPTLSAMAYGKVPDPTQRAHLQRAGVLLALWDGSDDGVLRFQLNRLVTQDSEHSVRNSRRAPTHTPVRMLQGEREKAGMLYSLSEGGCFVETPRASMEGAELRMLFQLADIDYDMNTVVVFSNVPGNLQRPNLPLGMGFRFKDMPDEARWQLADFIRDRMEALEV